ncbi:MAG: hypothetical protein ABI859_08560 [Pseudomonadota bacterium]
MKPINLSTTRRGFLAAAGGAAAVTAATARGSLTGAQTLDAAQSASVVLHDPKLPMPEDVARRLKANGARIIRIDDDPVRMWRQELGAVLRDPQTKLFGLTLWADYLIVRGLAAETRRHARYEQLHAETGHFTWLIA